MANTQSLLSRPGFLSANNRARLTDDLTKLRERYGALGGTLDRLGRARPEETLLARLLGNDPRGAEQQLFRVAEYLDRFVKPTERYAAAVRLLGSADLVEQLRPLLSLRSADLRTEQRKLLILRGGPETNAEIAQAGRLRLAYAELSAGYIGLKRAISGAASPTIVNFIQFLSDKLLRRRGDIASAAGAFVKTAADIGKGLLLLLVGTPAENAAFRRSIEDTPAGAAFRALDWIQQKALDAFRWATTDLPAIPGRIQAGLGQIYDVLAGTGDERAAALRDAGDGPFGRFLTGLSESEATKVGPFIRSLRADADTIRRIVGEFYAVFTQGGDKDIDLRAKIVGNGDGWILQLKEKFDSFYKTMTDLVDVFELFGNGPRRPAD